MKEIINLAFALQIVRVAGRDNNIFLFNIFGLVLHYLLK